MHPASSIVLFTTASGAGYGLLFLLGLMIPAGLAPAERGLGWAGLGAGLLLVATGLLASTFHLGHPERAWRALSQWRSSWLSREGVAALATFVPALLFCWGWLVEGRPAGAWGLAGVLTAAGAVATVWCTAMIYRSLAAIPAWANPWTLPNYLVLGLASGAVWLHLLARLFGGGEAAGWVALAALAVAWLGKAAYWRSVAEAPARATAESATGLGGIGKVRLLAGPHTEENYLMREMGYRVARKHAAKLRRFVQLGGFAAPLVLTALALATGGVMAGLFAAAAAVLASAGIVVERWLFFAEAVHTVTLYYGREAA